MREATANRSPALVTVRDRESLAILIHATRAAISGAASEVLGEKPLPNFVLQQGVVRSQGAPEVPAKAVAALAAQYVGKVRSTPLGGSDALASYLAWLSLIDMVCEERPNQPVAGMAAVRYLLRHAWSANAEASLQRTTREWFRDSAESTPGHQYGTSIDAPQADGLVIEMSGPSAALIPSAIGYAQRTGLEVVLGDNFVTLAAGVIGLALRMEALATASREEIIDLSEITREARLNQPTINFQVSHRGVQYRGSHRPAHSGSEEVRLQALLVP